MIAAWLRAFLITLAIETPLVVLLLAAVEPSRARRAGAIFFANLATHPAVWFVFPRLALSYTASTALAELWAFSLEAIFYLLMWPRLGRRVLWISLLANGASAGVGFALAALGWL